MPRIETIKASEAPAPQKKMPKATQEVFDGINRLKKDEVLRLQPARTRSCVASRHQLAASPRAMTSNRFVGQPEGLSLCPQGPVRRTSLDDVHLGRRWLRYSVPAAFATRSEWALMNWYVWPQV